MSALRWQIKWTNWLGYEEGLFLIQFNLFVSTSFPLSGFICLIASMSVQALCAMDNTERCQTYRTNKGVPEVSQTTSLVVCRFLVSTCFSSNTICFPICLLLILWPLWEAFWLTMDIAFTWLWVYFTELWLLSAPNCACHTFYWFFWKPL